MTNTLPWPWPQDSREDRAKRVARSYRNALEDIARGRHDTNGLPPDAAGDLYRLDVYWARYGIHWTTRRADLTLDPDDWMSAPDLAHALDRTRKDIYNWARLGHIQQRTAPDGAPEYSVASVINYQRKLIQRRMRGPS